MQLIECVPNFSEGRDPAVISAIRDSIARVANVRILDQHTDYYHHRTVITFVGTPAGVMEAAFQMIATAARQINLEQHQGAHPRIGATDVVPLIPIQEIAMPACVDLARQLGERVGTELGIPVYLYEQAALRPDRQNLADVRRGEYALLKDQIAINPARFPDFGPAKLSSAGATAIGARAPLIAYNVYLNSDSLEIAKAIAKSVRHSNGGLRYVKALGLLINGQAQVSLNLTNFAKTPIFQAVELIRREAVRYGLSITHCELVGLVPQQALIDAATWYLQLDGFAPTQVLENRLNSVNWEGGDLDN